MAQAVDQAFYDEFLRKLKAKELMQRAQANRATMSSMVPIEDQAGYENMPPTPMAPSAAPNAAPNAALSSSFVPIEEQLTDYPAPAPASNEPDMEELIKQDREFLAAGGGTPGGAVEGSGESFASESEPAAPVGTPAKQFTKEDMAWFQKETGTKFNPNSVADVYYLMNRKYNKLSEKTSDKLERSRQKGSAKVNAERVQKMRALMGE